MGPMPGMGAGMMLLWGVVILALLTLAVLGSILLARRLGQPGRTTGQDTPEEILRRRYAAGEIDHEEYQRRLNDLSQR